MVKLHELLAVEGELKAQAQRDVGVAQELFENGKGKLLGQTLSHQPATENDEQLPPKITLVATTVDEQLGTIERSFGRWIDGSLQKEATNQRTQATLDLGGELIELPATALLNLESKLLELRAVYRAIPTNDVTISWRFNEDIGQFVSDPPEVRRNTKKVMRAFVAYEATPDHPAQVETYNEDTLAGHITISKQSGMLTPRDKQVRLERLADLIQAVKKARQRANDIEVLKVEIGRQIFDFINGE